MRHASLTAAVILATAGVATAQSENPAGGGRLGTTVSVRAGLTSGSMDHAGQALGATIVQELGSRWALEASAAYLAQGHGASALAADASVLFHLRPARERAVPYVALGGGLYRTSFDMDDQRMRDGGWQQRGGMPGPGGMMGGHMPQFYAHRMGANPDPAQWRGERSFTDPAISAGAGIRIGLGSGMFLRPDGRVLVALDGGDSHTVGLVSVSFGWRF